MQYTKLDCCGFITVCASTMNSALTERFARLRCPSGRTTLKRNSLGR